MRDLRAVLAFALVACITGSTVAAVANGRTSPGHAAQAFDGTGRIPGLDGVPVTVDAPSGLTFAAWTHRASGEFDIAISVRQAGQTLWAAPVFVGRLDGVDETQPAIALDARGTLYVAYTITGPNRVALITLPAGSDAWTTPVIVSGTDPASTPSLLLVGDRLIVAYRNTRGVGVINLPVVSGEAGTEGIQDSPDGVDPLGYKQRQSTSEHTSLPNP